MNNYIIQELYNFGFSETQINLYLTLVWVVIIVAVVLVLWIFNFLIKKLFKKQLDLVVLKVSIPKFGSDEKYSQMPSSQQELAERLGPAESFFTSIAQLISQKGLKAWLRGRNDYYSFEIVLEKDGRIYFYVATPREMVDYIQEQISAQYSDAVVVISPDYNIFDAKGAISGYEFKQKKEYILPLKTYRQLESDSMQALTINLAKVTPGTGVAIQFLVRSANPKWHNWGQKTASKAMQGMKVSEAIKKTRGIKIKGGNVFVALWSFFDSFIKLIWEQIFSSKLKKDEQTGLKTPDKYNLTQREQEMIKGIEDKAAKHGLEANIRIVVSGKNQISVQREADNIANSFFQFNIPEYGNSLVATKNTSAKFLKNFIFREFDESTQMIINSEEAASIFHFPLGYIDTPNIAWLSSRQATAPVNIPKTGLYLGENQYRGKSTPVFIMPSDRRRHMYVIGMTGSGKSKFLDACAVRDIQAGHGVCFIDPLGDDVDLVLANVPPERANDVVYFDPSETSSFFGLNMLEYNVNNPQDKIFVVNQVFDIFDKLYDLKATGGPIFEQYMKNACMLIMDDPESGSTLMEVPKVLSDDDFRKYKLSKCKTPVVKDFWEKEAQKAGGEASLQNMVPYITSKLTPFIANDLVRPIIAQQKTTLDFVDAMNNQKILLIKLPKGKIGEINANLLGMIIIGKILQAAFSRADMPEEQRKDFYLYIDEFHNFLTPAINTILSEARKYRLCLIIAHQFIGQLINNGDEKIKNAIFGNVGTKISFRIGVEDAEQMAEEFKPVFSQYDVMNVPPFNACVKLLVDNGNPPPFSMAVPWFKGLDNPNLEFADKLKKMSKSLYAKTLEEVDAELEKRKSFVAVVEKKKEISLEDLFK